MEKVVVFYYIVYYLVGVKLELLPSLKDIGDLKFTETTVFMVLVYFIIVIISQVITYAGVDLFTKEKED